MNYFLFISAANVKEVIRPCFARLAISVELTLDIWKYPVLECLVIEDYCCISSSLVTTVKRRYWLQQISFIELSKPYTHRVSYENLLRGPPTRVS